jgi:hypothetical protein
VVCLNTPLGVPPKTLAQQGMLCVHRVREGLKTTLECELIAPAQLENQDRGAPGRVHLDLELVQPAPEALGLELSLAQ